MANIRKNCCVNSKKKIKLLERQKDRQKDQQKNGQKDRQKDRQILIYKNLLAMAGGPIKHMHTG